MRRYGNITVLGSIGVALLACVSCVKGKNNECADGTLAVSFFSRTVCQTQDTFPESIVDLLVLVFDSDGILVDYRKTDEETLTSDHRELFSVTPNAMYYTYAWTGVDDPSFRQEELLTGSTRREDLLVRLRRTGGEAYPTDGMSVWFGEGPPAYVTQSEPAQVRVNMLEITNRITVIVEGLEEPMTDYSIAIESDNGSMTLEGKIADDAPILYEAVERNGTDTVVADFTVLKLDTGHIATISISDVVTGDELFRGSLLGALLLENPTINLACDHDFVIRFRANDTCECGTYVITDAWVNDWKVNSYNLDK